MEINRCMNCMREYQAGETVCPVCGNHHGMEEQPVHALRCGTILHGKYLVGRVMGQGGFGITYIGLDMVLNLKVAIKEYFPANMAGRSEGSLLLWHTSVADRETGCNSFLKEARKMARIDRIPSVVSVRDMFLENETAYIIMEFVEGETLKAKLKREGTMKFSECIRLLTPIIEGLEKVHQQGIIHRDIKPDNIMLQPDKRAVLLDLGAAKELDSQQKNAETATTNLIVTQGFSPLEQYMNSGKIGPWTDVYALCATIYYCITGKVPIPSLDRIQKEEMDFSGPMKEKLSASDIAALKKGLALRYEERTQDMGELKRSFTVTHKPFPRPVIRKKKAAAGAAAAAAIAAVSLALLGKPSLTVVQYGQSNANVANGGEYLTWDGDEGSFEYFIGEDNGLYVCKADQDGTFYIMEAPKMAENASDLCKGDGSIYFLSGEDGENSICCMKPDGSNVETLYAAEDGELQYMQYAVLSDKEAYLYFLQYEELDEDDLQISLCRYVFADQSVESLIGDEWISCYSLGKDKIYYNVWDEESGSFVLKQADLEGKQKKTLVEDKNLIYGFADENNDLLFMYSYVDLAMLTYNTDGTRNNEMKGTYGLHVANTEDCVSIGYDGDWFYYKNGDDSSLHRVRRDGTGDSVLAEGSDAVNICCAGGWLYVSASDGESEDGRSCYFLYKDGTGDMVMVGNASGENPAVESGGNLNNTQTGLLYEEEEGHIVVYGYTGKEQRITIPDTLEGLPVAKIGDSAFRDTEIEEVILPESLQVIEPYAFAYCKKLANVEFKDGLQKIDEAAFWDCESLEAVEFPETLTEIGKWAFGFSGLKEIYIPVSMETIGRGAFGRVSTEFTEFGISPDNPYFSIDTVGNLYTKDYRTLICCPSGKTGIIQFFDGLENIEGSAFFGCRLLREIVFPDSVKAIRAGAFRECEELSRLVIPESVRTIESTILVGCDRLEKVTISADCQCAEDAFQDFSGKIEYYGAQ